MLWQVCKNYSRAYIHCLVTKDAMGSQLLSYHNLFYMLKACSTRLHHIISKVFLLYFPLSSALEFNVCIWYNCYSLAGICTHQLSMASFQSMILSTSVYVFWGGFIYDFACFRLYLFFDSQFYALNTHGDLPFLLWMYTVLTFIFTSYQVCLQLPPENGISHKLSYMSYVLFMCIMEKFSSC